MSEDESSDIIPPEVSTEDLAVKVQQLGLQYSPEIIRAYYDKEQRLADTLEFIREAVALYDLNTPDCIRSSKDPRFMKVWQQTEGWIEYAACVCMGLGDVSALFLNHAFTLGINPRQVYLSYLSKYNKPTCQNQLWDRLKSKLADIISMEEYKFIQDLNNYAKHNNVVCTYLPISFKARFFDVKIKPFKHHDSQHSETSLDEFIRKIRIVHAKLTDLYTTFVEDE